MYTYALLDVNGICTGFVEVSRKIIKVGYLLVEQRDTSLIGKVWNGASWTDGELTDAQQAALDTAFNVDYLVCLADLGI